jgi:hypothetical protein
MSGGAAPFAVTRVACEELQRLLDERQYKPTIATNPSLRGEGGSGIAPAAYSVQHELRRIRQGRGEVVCGFKTGCTSQKIRTQLGLKESVHGYLWENEQHSSGKVVSPTDFYGLAIEGELAVKLLTTASDSPADWDVEYYPVIELHHGKFDGPPEGRAAELVAKNCIHAGVVHPTHPTHQRSSGSDDHMAAGWRAAGIGKQCKLNAIPLDVPINVTIGGVLVEAPVLSALELDGVVGPLATVSWLHRRLKVAAAEDPDGADVLRLCDGMVVLTATPGGLIPVDAVVGVPVVVEVQFGGQQVVCTVQRDGSG